MTISMRQFYTVQMTNMFSNSVTASWDHGTTTFRGTPKQCVAALNEFKKISGGCNVSARVLNRDGSESNGVTVRDLRDAVSDAWLSANVPN